MAITREGLTPTLIENTIMQKVFRDGTHIGYEITPDANYVLHDKGYDEPVYDDDGNETDEIILGYRTATASCAADYDFSANPREFYAVLRSEVPENQIFGSTTKPEVS